MRASAFVLTLAIALAGAASSQAQTLQGTDFTYQGLLSDGGNPATGNFDFLFDLYQADAGGASLANDAATNVAVSGGLFTVTLDFGAAFTGYERWLQIRVRPAGGGAYTTLAPRQLLSATPYALALRLPLAESIASASPAFSITNTQRAIQGIVNAPYSGSLPGFPIAVLGSTTSGNGVVGATEANFGYGVNGIASGDSSQAVRGFQTSASGRAGYFVVSNSANTANALEVTTNGADSGQAFRAVHTGLGDCALFEITNASNVGECVEGRSNGAGDVVQAVMTGAGRAGYFQLDNAASDATAVYVTTNGDSSNAIEGIASGAFSYGVRGVGLSAGVRGEAGTSNGAGVYGVNNASTGTGVRGDSSGSAGAGIAGYCNPGTGVYGQSTGGGYGVYGSNGGSNSNGYAGRFNGRVEVTGNLSKGGGSFKIDHPLDPENKYLYHSFVESPDMMNIYNGNVTLDAQGAATVVLPNYFEALNRDFRYQLTCIGGHAPVYVAQEVTDGHFRIAGGKPGLKVSWQVTGIRHDPYAEANRVPVEETKDSVERGSYLYPAAYGQPLERSVADAQLRARQAADEPLPAGGNPLSH